MNFRVGTAGVVGGAALTGFGLLTNNKGLTNTGLNVGAAGVGSKLLAHVIGKRNALRRPWKGQHLKVVALFLE